MAVTVSPTTERTKSFQDCDPSQVPTYESWNARASRQSKSERSPGASRRHVSLRFRRGRQTEAEGGQHGVVQKAITLQAAHVFVGWCTQVP